MKKKIGKNYVTGEKSKPTTKVKINKTVESPGRKMETKIVKTFTKSHSKANKQQERGAPQSKVQRTLDRGYSKMAKQKSAGKRKMNRASDMKKRRVSI